jgi:hypothetical protein
MRIIFTFSWLLIGLMGCTSGYEEFYSDESKGVSSHIKPESTEPLRLMKASGDWKFDTYRMYEDGYVRIGSASFNGAIAAESALRAQAEKVGADVVIVSSDFTNSVTSAIPITTTNTVTTYHSGTANAYGSGGSVFGSYAGSSTSYVPNTTYVPLTISRYDQAAVFFRKAGESCLSLMSGFVSVGMRQELGTNRGILVAAVRRGGAAYNADIITGDVVLEVGGVPVYEGAPIYAPSRSPLRAKIWRGGEILEKEITTGLCS